jgi:hypothetical protein
MAGGVPGVQEDGKISGLARPDVQSSKDVPLHFLRGSQAVNPGVLQTTQTSNEFANHFWLTRWDPML